LLSAEGIGAAFFEEEGKIVKGWLGRSASDHGDESEDDHID